MDSLPPLAGGETMLPGEKAETPSSSTGWCTGLFLLLPHAPGDLGDSGDNGNTSLPSKLDPSSKLLSSAVAAERVLGRGGVRVSVGADPDIAARNEARLGFVGEETGVSLAGEAGDELASLLWKDNDLAPNDCFDGGFCTFACKRGGSETFSAKAENCANVSAWLVEATVVAGLLCAANETLAGDFPGIPDGSKTKLKIKNNAAQWKNAE